MTDPEHLNDPKKRLLDAAIAFMRDGEAPTTRALAERAGVNLAAINYYFQGKDNLMAEALDQAALADLTRWVQAELPASMPPREQLDTLALFLGRIHGSFHEIANLQLRSVALAGRLDRATALACRTLARLLAACRGHREADDAARVGAASIMAAIHYTSIHHTQFEALTGISVATDAARDAYVRALVAQALGTPEVS